jgi:Helix-turn-helix
MTQFGEMSELVRAARKTLALSQREFASALGVKLSRLQKWERGVNEPRFAIIEMRRLRGLDRQVFDGLVTGSLSKSASPRPSARRPESAAGADAHELCGNISKLRLQTEVTASRARALVAVISFLGTRFAPEAAAT